MTITTHGPGRPLLIRRRPRFNQALMILVWSDQWLLPPSSPPPPPSVVPPGEMEERNDGGHDLAATSGERKIFYSRETRHWGSSARTVCCRVTCRCKVRVSPTIDTRILQLVRKKKRKNRKNSIIPSDNRIIRKKKIRKRKDESQVEASVASQR